MNVPNLNKPTTGLTLLFSAMFAVSAQAGGPPPPEIPFPTRASDESVAVIPFEFGFCDEGRVQSCPDGLTEVRQPVSCESGGSVSIALSVDEYGGVVTDFSCNDDDGDQVSDPAIDWSYGEDGDGFPPPISLVLLESCVEDRTTFFPGDDVVFYNEFQVADAFVYETFGETADGGLYLCGRDEDGSCLESDTGFIDVTFCLGAAGTPAQTETVEIPACPTGPTGYCPEPVEPEDKSSLLIQVTAVTFDELGNPTQVIRPADETACLCKADDPDASLQQCDPGAAAGAPNACETGDEDGPAQTLLNEEISAEYYCWEAGKDKFCYKFPGYTPAP